MSIKKHKLLANTYRDSVALMQLSAGISNRPGIEQAFAMMATPANMELLVEAGLIIAPIKAGPSDLLLALSGETETAIDEAIDAFETALDDTGANQSESTDAGAMAPRSIEMALGDMPQASLALISCPGEYAAAEARKALQLGLDVMLFSDHIALEDEVELKAYADAHNRLVMGPDCGTAIIDGIPLGFANVVNPGNIGIVAASGTGLQQVSCLIDSWGGGISQAIGTGGRDLNSKVGGRTMIRAIEQLSHDADTKVIVLVSKPPAPEVAAAVSEKARRAGKPVIINFLGADMSTLGGGNIVAAETLEQAAHTAFHIAQSGARSPDAPRPFPVSQRDIDRLVAGLASSQKYVRGLYSGGTFSYEAMLLLGQVIGPVHSSTPVNKDYRLNDIWTSTGNTVVDLGDDRFTRGRPHPMIDQRLRNDRMEQEAADPETAVILLDVVLGYGSHLNPMEEIGPAIAKAKAIAKNQGSNPIFVSFVCGTDKDPQNKTQQEMALKASGVIVVDNNTQAVRLAAEIIRQVQP
ncbi:acyl-CoA synthetase FdrA [Candidatus Entotheonella palauensis]|uniref:FdrA family protein n=1 Tax=Candidatus Entotheonella gemina TaxID=1429439 RepID=W4M5T4_9BACT|nr:acyl-CoA synthetase FdrA [Candidatus Entotheonella palauensis]ETX05709.1 MAG: hypothetical protein ETSY2_21360 [Candidatus Entotheonella gemina]